MLKPFLLRRSSIQVAPLSPPPHHPMKSFQVAAASTLSVALFADVSNSRKHYPLLQRLRRINSRIMIVTKYFRELLDLMQSGKMEPEVALLNASLVPDIFPVLAAAHKALVSKSRESLTTRTIHSELVYNYSASKHISESLKRCGISDQTSYILAARFNASDDEMTSVTNLIKGKEIDLGELESRSNRDQMLKRQRMQQFEHSLKTNGYGSKNGIWDNSHHYKVPPQELAISSISDAITCRIAARDAL